MERYYSSLVIRFLGGILIVFLSFFAIIIGFPWLMLAGVLAGAYISFTAYREGSRA